MPTTSLHGKILDVLEAAIEGLGLSGLAAANIVKQCAPTDQEKWLPALPGIILAPLGDETIKDATNAGDDIGYPTLIAIVASANQDQTFADLDQRLVWREKIIDHLIHNRLAISHTGAQLYDQTIQPLPILDQAAWFRRNLFISTLVLKAWVRKHRRA